MLIGHPAMLWALTVRYLIRQGAKTGNGPAVPTRPGPSAIAEGSGQQGC